MHDATKVSIYSNAKLHYTIVSGNSDEPFVLIHGQCMCGLDYDKVTEKLSEKYTLYLIDCFGHGESEKAPELYCCRIIGDAIADLISNEIGRPCIVSGHSSGGILAAYVAGVMPELVKGILWAANTDESAEKVMCLLSNGKKKVVRSGHDIHFEKPRHFLKAMKMLEKIL